MTNKNRVLVIISGLFLVGLFFADLAMAQMNPIYRFKGVNVPVKLKVNNKTLEKGGYDLEFLRTSSPVLYFLRIIKGGKILSNFQGEEWPYAHGLVDSIAFSGLRIRKKCHQLPLYKSEIHLVVRGIGHLSGHQRKTNTFARGPCFPLTPGGLRLILSTIVNDPRTEVGHGPAPHQRPWEGNRHGRRRVLLVP